MAEIDLACVAAQQVPALCQDDSEEYLHTEIEQIVSRGKQRQRSHQHRERASRPKQFHACAPKRRWGRTSKTMRKRMSPTTSRYGPPRNTTLIASASPRMMPPAKLPKSEPRPARTITTSALSVHSRPMDGLIA